MPFSCSQGWICIIEFQFQPRIFDLQCIEAKTSEAERTEAEGPSELQSKQISCGVYGRAISEAKYESFSILGLLHVSIQKSGIPSGGIPFWQDFLNKAKLSFGGTQVRWDSY